jgi:hypothetical protein
MNVVNEKD